MKGHAAPELHANTTDATELDALIQKHEEFRAFLRKQLGRDSDVDDLLQHALIKALKRRDSIRQNEKTISWFYRLLRRSLIDYYRGESTRKNREVRWATEQATLVAPPEMKRALCTCVDGLLPGLGTRPATLLRRVDLGGEPVATVAASLGLKANAATVALHRARAQLRRKLVSFCGSCAQGACLDCYCTKNSM
jgi:RNA polymerase sigma-70 factor (ECF subfamily)